MKIVALDKVSLSYASSRSLFSKNRKSVISDFTLEVNSGENVGIVGRNGAGKTSLLKMIAGIIQPDQGTVWRKDKLRSAFIGVRSGFVPYMSGIENVYLTGLLLGLDTNQIDARLQAIIDYADIGSSINDQVASYSAGMRARLAFSISLHSEPELLLIDEAMGVGDRDFRKKSNQSLRQIIGTETTSIIVSHEIAYLRKVCSQIVWIEGGNVVTQGEPELVLKEYCEAA